MADQQGSLVNIDNGILMKEFYQQYCTPHEESLLPPSCMEKDAKISSHLFSKSRRTSATLEMINYDDLETFPKIEWCDDGGVEEDECSCSSTVTKKRDSIKTPRGSSCEENKENKENSTNGIAACHHHHGLVRSMCIRSRLSVLAGPQQSVYV